MTRGESKPVEATESIVLQTVPLGAQWPTIDPFLFCAHHNDLYPPANADMGPAAELSGRQLCQDFAGVDGWNMYHGQVVPGFPQHPHRGFETVSFVRKGLIDHSDSMGAHARFGRGDVQWMTAGNGVVHSEMFPLLDVEHTNPLEMFQVWLNLPASDKLVDPYFTMFWDGDIPRHRYTDAVGRTTEITLIAGALGQLDALAAPPNSWAAKPESDVAIWHICIDAGGSWTMPRAHGDQTNRMLYVFEGDSLIIGDHEVAGLTGSVIRADIEIDLRAGDNDVECLLLQGRPIGEPVAQYGPFVMNTHAEIEQAFGDYRATEFGGWPWPTDAPVHARERGRYAHHSDGRTEDIG